MRFNNKDSAYYLKSRYTKKKTLFACRALAKIGQVRYLKRARSNNKKGSSLDIIIRRKKPDTFGVFYATKTVQGLFFLQPTLSSVSDGRTFF